MIYTAIYIYNYTYLHIYQSFPYISHIFPIHIPYLACSATMLSSRAWPTTVLFWPGQLPGSIALTPGNFAPGQLLSTQILIIFFFWFLIPSDTIWYPNFSVWLGEFPGWHRCCEVPTCDPDKVKGRGLIPGCENPMSIAQLTRGKNITIYIYIYSGWRWNYWVDKPALM